MFVMAPDGILNDIQETQEKTEAERKRDHRNALRRAAYWRNKVNRIQDQNKHASAMSGMRLRSISISMAGPAISICDSSKSDESKLTKYELNLILIQTTEIALALQN
jgi:hypothetical protein